MTEQTFKQRCIEIIQAIADNKEWKLSQLDIEAVAEFILPYLAQAHEQSKQTTHPIAIDGLMVYLMLKADAHDHNRLWTEWRQYFVKILVRKGLSREDCDDIAQNACREAFKSLSKFRFQSRLETFLYRILANCIAAWFKDAKKEPKTKEPFIEDKTEGETGQYTQGRDHLREAEDDSNEFYALIVSLQQALQTLSDEELQILHWYYIEGWKDREIAKHLDKPRDTISSKRLKSIRKLRAVLE